MATPDMEVIKEIPGYKVILKAVLKSQIQQLVEHLASFTEEESVILTASVSDGTLSHLGSDSGKFFLDDHEDIKSQFLGFCLKRHHRKKQEKEREEREEREEAMRAAANQYAMRSPSGPRFMHRAPRMPSPRQQGLHPISMTRASPGAGPRGPYRHEPYPMASPRRTSLNFEPQGPGIPSGNNVIVKVEPSEGNDTADSDVNSSLTPSRNKPDQDDDNRSNSSSSTLPIDPQEGKLSDVQPPGGLGLDSDLSTAIGDNTSDTDTNVANIKVEAVSEAEMELEITGVEPGRPQVPPPESWAPAMPGGFDQSGATGSAADMQGYIIEINCADISDKDCSLCGKTCQSKSAREVHELTHTKENNFECDICGKCFSQKPLLTMHRVLHKYGYECSVCGKVCRTKAARRKHERIHEDETPFECGICDKGFRYEHNLRVHMRSHNSDNKCSTCGKTFTYKSARLKHERSHNDNDEKPLICDICGKGFKYRKSMNVHKLSHDSDKSCSVCGKIFRNKYTRLMHERIHHEETPFECDICGKKFKHEGKLRTHKLAHTSDKDCSVCGKRCQSKAAREIHERIHSGVKPFECDICGKKFSQKGNMEGHKLSHRSGKSCSVCGKKFLSKLARQIHERIHSGDKPFECDICGRKFNQKGNMETHRLRCVNLANQQHQDKQTQINVCTDREKFDDSRERNSGNNPEQPIVTGNETAEV